MEKKTEIVDLGGWLKGLSVQDNGAQAGAGRDMCSAENRGAVSKIEEYTYTGRDGKVYELQTLNAERFIDLNIAIIIRKVELNSDDATPEGFAESIAKDEMALLRCVAISLMPDEKYAWDGMEEFMYEIAINLPTKNWKQVIIDTFSALKNVGFLANCRWVIDRVDAELARNPKASRQDLINLFEDEK